MADDTKNIDFNKEKDATGIVEHARRQGRMRWALPLDQVKDVKKQPAELEVIQIPPATSATPKASHSVSVAPKLGRLPLPGVACDEAPPSTDDPGGGTPSLCANFARSKSISRGTEAPEFAPITGPYEPLVTDNADYREGLELKAKLESIGVGLGPKGSIDGVDKFAPVPPPVREALLIRWRGIDVQRADLIGDARPLDADDEALSRFAVRLNVWLRNLRARKQALDGQLAEYNRLCLGRPLPEDEFRQCESYRTRYNNCAGRHNASVAERNRLVGVWQEGKKCLQTRGDSFRTQVMNWASLRIKPWITDARKAIENACDPVKKVRLVPANPPPIRTGGDILTLRGFVVYGGDKPCPIVRHTWTKLNSTGDIGNLVEDSADQTLATLTTGIMEAVGAVVLEVQDSQDNVERGSSVVTVSASVRTCELNKLASHPFVKNFCQYICVNSTPSGPLDDFGIPDPTDPSGLKCRPFVLQP